MNDNEAHWKTKVFARLHDPAEKALILLRDREGHEWGSSADTMQTLGGETARTVEVGSEGDAILRIVLSYGPSETEERWIQRADWWAAAADRPQFPKNSSRVRWWARPILIHPLMGLELNLSKLLDVQIGDLKESTTRHFTQLVQRDCQGNVDYRSTLLAYWRFGAQVAGQDDLANLGKLWRLLPADTRVPDHSIWDHLDLTSAFAGAFAADPAGEAALLALSIGPVQSFIAAARKMDDLWAGSHLLSRLAWEAMRPVCEALGPDAILFPRLRGIPQVDLWLRDTMDLPDELFKDCEWMRSATDANPLFSAALPNRFVAVVPASQARDIAEKVTQAVRGWLAQLGTDVVSRLLKEAGFDVEATTTPYDQMKAQLEGFPEVHWAAVPFSLIRCRDEEKQRDLDVSSLLGVMAPFFGVAPGTPCGFLATRAWEVLQQKIHWGGGTTFFAPNPGVLYPAVYDLAERVLASAKAARPFAQSKQEGWRESLAGETEWLTTDRAQLALPPGQRQDTLWTRIAAKRPAWAKKGEHLGALSAIKRLWPTVFAEEVGKALAAGERGEQKPVGRFVVSTHTMALAHQLDLWLERGGQTAPGTAEALKNANPVALPRRLTRRHAANPALADAKRIPDLLEAARDAEDDAALDKAQRQVKQTLGTALGQDEAKLETYYALLMMDGDHMGAILSGDAKTAITYRESFHEQVREGFDELAAGNRTLRAYGRQTRAVSPARHIAISAALNDFSQYVARHVVEEEHLGRVIYAGGDDVLAMLPVADLLPCMLRLRHAYSGTLPKYEIKDWGDLRKDPDTLHCKDGFAYLRGRLMRMMGEHATASTGAVVAHHQAPLAMVLRELRAAEQRAKKEGGRDAFSITVIKRSGGILTLTAKWGEPIDVLLALRNFLAEPAVSRRAVYNSLVWLKDLPPDAPPEMLGSLLGYQFKRQTASDTAWNNHDASTLCQRIAALACPEKDRLNWLTRVMGVAEFLAREARTGGLK